MKPKKSKKPVVSRANTDANIFSIIAAATEAMRKAGVAESESTAMCKAIEKTGSYHEALGVIMKYVDIR